MQLITHLLRIASVASIVAFSCMGNPLSGVGISNRIQQETGAEGLLTDTSLSSENTARVEDEPKPDAEDPETATDEPDGEYQAYGATEIEDVDVDFDDADFVLEAISETSLNNIHAHKGEAVVPCFGAWWPVGDYYYDGGGAGDGGADDYGGTDYGRGKKRKSRRMRKMSKRKKAAKKKKKA